MRSFSDTQAPHLIIQMFDSLLQYAVRINALGDGIETLVFRKEKSLSF